MKLKPENYAYNKRRAAARRQVMQQMELANIIHRCKKCTRELTRHESIAACVGPKCAKKER